MSSTVPKLNYYFKNFAEVIKPKSDGSVRGSNKSIRGKSSKKWRFAYAIFSNQYDLKEI